MNENTSTPPQFLRGLARLTPEERRAIASKGGKAVKPENRSFSRNPELAAEVGRRGGQKSSRAKKGR